MLSVSNIPFMLSVIMPNVVMMSVVAPSESASIVKSDHRDIFQEFSFIKLFLRRCWHSIYITSYILYFLNIIHNYSIPVNCTYCKEQINESTETDVFSLLHPKTPLTVANEIQVQLSFFPLVTFCVLI